jgi:hypothetical protein
MPVHSLFRSAICQVRMATLIVALMSSATTAFSQQSVHVETTVTNIVSRNFSYGPVSTTAPTCNAVSGGPGCKFVSFDFKGTCTTTRETDHADISKCTITGAPTVLLSFSPSGAHDQNGNPTGVCAPFFESLVTTYDDGGTLNANGQGEVCCADDSCSGGFGPPFVTHESTIITGGSGRFAGVKGSGIETSAGYADGSEFALQEQVWIFPKPSRQ